MPGVGALCKVFLVSVVLTLALTSTAFAQLVPTLSIDDVMLTEGDTGTTNATFTVTRTGNQLLVSTVNFATANDSATQPSDYASTSGTLTFLSLQTTQTITVSVNGDTLDEADERFFVDLSAAVDATISDGRGVGTIIDDDDTPQAKDDGSAENPITLTEDDPDGVTTNVLANDTGLGDTPIGVEVTTQPSKGTATVNTDKTITYKPDANENGPDTYKYTVTDSDNQTSTATVYLQITPVNDAPAASNDSISVEEDGETIFDPTSNDTKGPANEDGQALAVDSIVTQPSHGTATPITSGPDSGKVSYVPDADYNGPDSFTYRVCDDGTTDGQPDPKCDTATVDVTVTSVNDAPVARNDSANVNEDGSTNIAVLNNDTDADGQNDLNPASVRVVAQPNNGTATANPDGTITYTPNADFNGSDSFSYEVCDRGNPALCDTATVSVTVAAVNDAPVAQNDTANVNEDGSTNVAVLNNDTDADGQNDLNPASVRVVAQPQNGTASANANGTITYTPNADFNGNDSFSYEVCDRGNPALCDTATVNVAVSSVNDAPDAKDDTANVNEDGSVNVAVLNNDTDADGQGDLNPASVRVVAQSNNGTATANPNGTITYEPNDDFYGSDSFTYEVCDKQGACDTATVNISVAAVNDAPVARDDSASTPEDTPLTLTQQQLLANDDSGAANENQTLTITDVSNPINGTVRLNDDGTITFTPAENYNGNDASFDYTISDGQGNNSTATANVKVTVESVNDKPVAADDSATVEEDGSTDIAVLENDTDADGQNDLNPASVRVVNGPQNGTATANANGTITYKPNANFNGNDSFTYEVCDRGNPALCDTATVNITVNSVNDAPVARDDTANVNEDASTDIAVLRNDTDADGQNDLNPASVRVVAQPQNGTAVANQDGTITYEPNADFNGNDSFTYEVCDRGNPALCDTAMVNISVAAVNDAPVARDDSVSTPEDTPLTIEQSELLSNDGTGASNENQNLTVVDVSNPINGTVRLNDDGTITFTPAENYNGNGASFDYTISDGQGNTSTATANVNVTVRPVNDAPGANDDSASVNEDRSRNIAVLANDADPDGYDDLDPASVEIVDAPQHGTATVNNDGTITYTPDRNFNGHDSFSYEVCDQSDPTGCDTATVSMTVNAVNDVPVAKDDTANVNEDGTINIAVLSNDTDADGQNDLDAASVKVVDAPQHGTATVKANGTITFEPNADYNGTDTFQYRVCDDGTPSKCDTATVSVNVHPVAEPARPACNDGRDNDRDGRVDLMDPGCTSRSDNSEFNRKPQPKPPECTIKGTNGDDALQGTDRRDVICGFGGTDTIQGMGGNDLILGGDGKDAIQGGKGEDTIKGGNGDDGIQGQEGNDTLYGQDGSDTIQGQEGNDKLYGGKGNDTLRGGSGRDVSQQ